MTIHEKRAVFTLAVCGIAVAVCIALVPIIGPDRAWGALGIAGLAGLAYAPNMRRGAEQTRDERDLAISHRAQLMGFKVFWVGFVLSCVGIQYVVGDVLHRDTVSLKTLNYLLIGSWILFMTVTAVTTLVGYRHRLGHEA